MFWPRLRNTDDLAVLISAWLAEGYTLGQALTYVNQAAKDLLLPTMRTSYAGESKTFVESQTNFYVTFVLALATGTGAAGHRQIGWY